jgi:hypothetical protein
MGQVTVDAALRRGNLLLKVAPLVILLLFMVAPFMVSEVVDVHVGWLFAAGFVAALVLGWLWWSIAVTHWRIWAYTHVRNIHELMELAVNEKLLWPKGSYFERTEIRTKVQRELLQQLEARFATPDERIDDPAVPAQTVVKYARGQMAFLLAWGIAMIGFAAYLLTTDGSSLVPLLIAAMGVWVTVDGVRKLMRDRPMLVINSEGVMLNDGPRIPWEEISSTQVVLRGSGRSTRHLLEVHHGDSRSDLDIGSLSINKGALRHALKVHRLRWVLQQGGERVPTFVA